MTGFHDNLSIHGDMGILCNALHISKEQKKKKRKENHIYSEGKKYLTPADPPIISMVGPFQQ